MSKCEKSSRRCDLVYPITLFVIYVMSLILILGGVIGAFFWTHGFTALVVGFVGLGYILKWSAVIDRRNATYLD